MKIYNAVIAAVLASEKSYEYDFTDVFQAHEFVTKTADQLFNNLSFKTKRSKYNKNFKWLIENKLLCNLPVNLMIHFKSLFSQTSLWQTTRRQNHRRYLESPSEQPRIRWVTRDQTTTMCQISRTECFKRNRSNHERSC